VPQLSVLIPSRNEVWLARTIQDLLEHSESDFEIIAALDGQWAEPPIQDHERVTLLYFPQSIGQRAATNQACRIARGEYVVKVDAHCAFEQGWDKKMLAVMQPDWTMVPTMRNLHIFDWVCENGHRRYQGPSGPCAACGKPTVKDVVWIPKRNPQSRCYCFDPEPHFQYFRSFNERPEGHGDLTETMSLQGSFFMLSREKYWELDICNEDFGSWGSQGIEVAVKTWLSGGRVVVNQKTWYAHCFRTQGGDFGFPYDLSGRQVERAKKHAKKLFFENKWPLAKRPISWLVEKFWPIPGWKESDLEKLKAFDPYK
jgi:glycosyltransferase involved in cell wall biosynthesis